jgi:hypothetical protein
MIKNKLLFKISITKSIITNSHQKNQLENLNGFIKILNKHITFKKVDVMDGNYYHALGIKYDSDYDEIKKQYYKLAKKYHPDINKDPEAIEKFKKIKRAYEVLGNPNMRISYDLENKISDVGDSEKRRESDEKFYNRYGKRVMRGPRTIKNFYWDKWSSYKTPKWSNLNSGMDSRAEYIIRDTEDNLDISYFDNLVIKIIKSLKLLFYLIFIFSIDIYLFMDNWQNYKIYKMFKQTFFNIK